MEVAAPANVRRGSERLLEVSREWLFNRTGNKIFKYSVIDSYKNIY